MISAPIAIFFAFRTRTTDLLPSRTRHRLPARVRGLSAPVAGAGHARARRTLPSPCRPIQASRDVGLQHAHAIAFRIEK
jgi:hypothetical protein